MGRGGLPQQWKYAAIKILRKKKGRIEYGKIRGLALVAHAGKVLLKIAARSLSNYHIARGRAHSPNESAAFVISVRLSV